MSRPSGRSHARRIWMAGVRSVHAGDLVTGAVSSSPAGLVVQGRTVPLAPGRRLVVVGGGKAGAAMARGFEKAVGRGWPRERAASGLVNVPADRTASTRWISLHPARSGRRNQPTAAGVLGTNRMLRMIAPLEREDLVVCLLSGGGSALLPAPAEAVTLKDLQQVTSLLHAGGATINEMNAVRKHLSRVKGGGLARATRARVLTLIVSDVVADPIDVIASGPTEADPTTFADAIAVLHRLQLARRIPASIRRYLWSGAAGNQIETLKRRPARVTHHVLGNNARALVAATGEARRLGYTVINLGPALEGDSASLGVVLAGMAVSARDQNVPAAPPLCILSGGETTVNLGPSPGRGGRNQELVLAACRHLAPDGWRGITLLSGGTDGEDGPTDAAGAIADRALMARARGLGLDPARYLMRHDAYNFFAPAGGLLRIGATHTNVMDLRVVLVHR